jgi:hypothetical protein
MKIVLLHLDRDRRSCLLWSHVFKKTKDGLIANQS